MVLISHIQIIRIRSADMILNAEDVEITKILPQTLGISETSGTITVVI